MGVFQQPAHETPLSYAESDAGFLTRAATRKILVDLPCLVNWFVKSFFIFEKLVSRNGLAPHMRVDMRMDSRSVNILKEWGFWEL